LADRGSGGVDDARLDNKAVRVVRVAASGDIGLAGCYLGEGSAEMDGTGSPAFRRCPGHRPRKCPVDLADARSVNKAPGSALVSGRKPFTCSSEETLERSVKEHGLCSGQLGHIGDEMAGSHPRASVCKLAEEGID